MSGSKIVRLGDVADLVLPRRCIGCGRPATLLCDECVPQHTVRVEHRDLPVVAAADYADAVRGALLRYKERGRRDLARPLGYLLSRSVQALIDDRGVARRRVVLVPVPSSGPARRARDGDHVLALARRASALSGLPVRRPLRLGRAVQDSAGLSAADRAANLAAAMTARAPAEVGCATAAIVVDDIVTSGATLLEARRALTSAGWPVLGGAVVAATALRSERHGRARRTGAAIGNAS